VPAIAAAVIAVVALIATRAQTLESIFRDVRDVKTEYMLNYLKAGTDEQKICFVRGICGSLVIEMGAGTSVRVSDRST
jgi:hypothetical protein